MPASKPPSIQEILRGRQQVLFVGRHDLIDAFRQNLDLPAGDSRRRFVFNVFGQGGVGKTSLLRRFQHLSEQRGHITAWTSEVETDVAVVMGHISEQFLQQNLGSGDFYATYQTYRQLRLELEADPEAPQGLTLFLSHTFAKVGLRLGRQVPVAGALFDLVDENLVADQLTNLQHFIARKVKNKNDLRLIVSPVEVMTPMFLDTLRDIAASRRIDLFFDTYEQTSSFLDSWLRDLLDGTFGDVSTNVSFSIAGRYELDHNSWTPYHEIIFRIPLEAFSESEVREYLAVRKVTDDDVVKSIIEITGGLPLLVATLALEDPSRAVEIGNFSDTAVERFLKWVDNPKRRQVAVNTSLPRFFNKDTMRAITSDTDDGLFEWLKTMPFIIRRDDAWIYHEVVRVQLIRKKRLESPRDWIEIHAALADFFISLRKSLESATSKAEFNPVWQRCKVEEVYHRLCGSPQINLGHALNGFVEALSLKTEFARKWAEAIEEAGRDTQVGELTAWGRRLAFICEEGVHPGVVDALGMLISVRELDDRWRAVALSRKAVINFALGDTNDAATDMAKALELGSAVEYVLVNAGVLELFFGRPDGALAYFDKAREINPDDAFVTLGFSLAHLLNGNPEKARGSLGDSADLEPRFGFMEGLIAYFEELRTVFDAEQGASGEMPELPNLDMLDNEALLKFWKPVSAFSPIVLRLMHSYGPSIASKLGVDESLIPRDAETIKQTMEDFARQLSQGPNAAMEILQRSNLQARVLRSLKAGDLEEAVKIMTEAIERSPNEVDLVAKRASLYVELERYDEAIADFDTAVRISAEPRSKWQFQRGLTLGYLGRFAEAIDAYKLYLEAEPEDYKALYNLAVVTARAYGFGHAHFEVGRARAALARVSESEEGYAALYGMGGLEALGGDARAALDYLRKAVALGKEVLNWAKHDVAWYSLRGDPEFKSLLEPAGEQT
jgi:tetratricopeptide (TPR) repeat protein